MRRLIDRAGRVGYCTTFFRRAFFRTVSATLRMVDLSAADVLNVSKALALALQHCTIVTSRARRREGAIAMMTSLNEVRRVGIGKTLANRAGGVPSALAAAEATLAIWQQITARLEPVIGAGGVRILFWRSLMLTGRKFPWLMPVAMAADGNDGEAMFAGFRDALKNRDPVDATAAGCALLVTLTEILDSLVGAPMTESSLGELWSPPPVPPVLGTEGDGT